ncbi:MAG: hypothetical protein R6X14_00200 [bacterium]
MKRLLVLAALAATTTGLFALNPGQLEFEHNGWFRYTNTSTSFGVTDPSVSRFALERGYLRTGYRWTEDLYTKFTIDIFSSDKYPDGATVRLKEAYIDFALPVKDFLFTAGLQKHYFGLVHSWNYTHPDKSLGDAQGIAASSEYGLVVSGKLPNKLGELQLGLYNGEGYQYVGKYVNTVPELLANLRLTPLPWVMVGGSVMYHGEDMSRYRNDSRGRTADGMRYMMADTVNAGVLGFAPVFEFKQGPVTLLGEAILHSFSREFSYYDIDRDTAGSVTDSALVENSRKYARSGFDVMPLVTVLDRKLDVFARFTTWEQREEAGDGSMAVNLDRSLVRYGVGMNWHFYRRSGGRRPGAALQLAWVREQTRKEGSEPKDVLMAQFRFEWATVIAPGS